MSTELNAATQTLADVKAGDVVIIDGSRHGHPIMRQGVVTKVTRTQIVIGSGRFRRDNGREINAHSWHHDYVVFGEDAEKLASLVRHHKAASDFLHACHNVRRSDAHSIRAIRAACDAAEAALREAGGWIDE